MAGLRNVRFVTLSPVRPAAAGRQVLVRCRSAQRAYYATRILLQNGFKARNLSGGMLARTYSQLLTS